MTEAAVVDDNITVVVGAVVDVPCGPRAEDEDAEVADAPDDEDVIEPEDDGADTIDSAGGGMGSDIETDADGVGSAGSRVEVSGSGDVSRRWRPESSDSTGSSARKVTVRALGPSSVPIMVMEVVIVVIVRVGMNAAIEERHTWSDVMVNPIDDRRIDDQMNEMTVMQNASIDEHNTCATQLVLYCEGARDGRIVSLLMFVDS